MKPTGRDEQVTGSKRGRDEASAQPVTLRRGPILVRGVGKVVAVPPRQRSGQQVYGREQIALQDIDMEVRYAQEEESGGGGCGAGCGCH